MGRVARFGGSLWLIGIWMGLGLGIGACSKQLSFQDVTGYEEKDILKFVMLPTEGVNRIKTPITVDIKGRFRPTNDAFRSPTFRYQIEIIFSSGEVLPCSLSGTLLECQKQGRRGSFLVTREIKDLLEREGFPLASKWKRDENYKPKFKGWQKNDTADPKDNP